MRSQHHNPLENFDSALYSYAKARLKFYEANGHITEVPTEDLTNLPEAQPIGLCTLDVNHHVIHLHVVKGYPGLWVKNPDPYFKKSLEALVRLATKKEAMFARIAGCTMTGYFVRAKAVEERLEEGARLAILERDQEKIDADVQRTLSKLRERQIEAGNEISPNDGSYKHPIQEYFEALMQTGSATPEQTPPFFEF